MTQSRRTMGLCLALAALAAPTFAQDLGELYREGVDLLSRGRKEEALAKFQAILAADPSDEAAYELWKEADHQVFLDLIVEGGEWRLVAERMLSRARLGRTAHRDDADAVRELTDELIGSSDALRRRQIVTQLAAEHGPYSATALVPYLGDEGNEDRRVVAMAALIELGGDVIWPLVAALGSDSAYLRRNAAICLGRIGDARTAGALEACAALDADAMVIKAAKDAAAACGSNGNAVASLLAIGDGFHQRSTQAIRPFEDQDAIWSWDGGVASTSVPTAIYNDHMALWAYTTALGVAAADLNAQAGVTRSCASIVAKAGMMDDDAVSETAATASLVLASAGTDATDLALAMAVATDDAMAGAELCKALAICASAPTAGLGQALSSADSTLRGEAALALAAIAGSTGSDAGGATVAGLAEAAGRDVLRVAAIVDGNAERSGAVLSGLSAQGVMVDHRSSGVEGIVLVRRMPVVDMILVGDRVGGLTTDQVLADIARQDHLAEVPVFLMSSDEEFADAMSDRVAGVISDAADLSALEEAMSADLDGDRAQADALGARAAAALAALAGAGNTDCSGAAGALASTLAFRADAVTVPAMAALQRCGSWENGEALMSVLADSSRSDEARVAAAHAIGGIAARSGAVDAAMGALAAAAGDGGNSAEVRGAAARAIGMCGADRAARTGVMGALLTGGSAE